MVVVIIHEVPFEMDHPPIGISRVIGNQYAAAVFIIIDNPFIGMNRSASDNLCPAGILWIGLAAGFDNKIRVASFIYFNPYFCKVTGFSSWLETMHMETLT